MQTQNENMAYICALCLTPLTSDNDSEEHVIPNSIGGWMTVTGFICRKCNNQKGQTWDAVFAEQFAWMSSMAGVVRDRGTIPPVEVTTISGKAYKLRSDGTMVPKKFEFNRVSDGEGFKISFIARDMGEMRKKVAELKKKYKNFDEQAALASSKITTSYLAEPLQIELASGGPDAGRSTVASALAYAVKLGVNPHVCEMALPFLRQPELPATCYGWNSLVDVVRDRVPGQIFHCVSIHGDPENRFLWAYVEYFSYARWYIELSRQYDGPAITSTYAIAPNEALEIQIYVDWNIDRTLLARILDGDGYDPERTNQSVELIMNTIMARSRDRSFNLAYQAACKEVMAEMNIREDGILPSSLLPIFAEKVKQAMAPFIEQLETRTDSA